MLRKTKMDKSDKQFLIFAICFTAFAFGMALFRLLDITYLHLYSGEPQPLGYWLFNRLLILTFPAGLVYLISGIFVIIKKPFDKTAKIFYLASSLIGFVLVLAGRWRISDALFGSIGSVMVVVCGIMSLGLFLHFYLVFPEEKSFMAKYKTVSYLLYLPALIITAFWILTGRSFDFGLIILMIYALLIVFALYHSHKTIRHPLKRRQFKVVFWGSLLGYLPLAFLLPLILYLGLQQVKPSLVAIFLVAWFIVPPAAFSYAILKRQFLDIEIVIRKGLIYSAVTAFIIISYLLFVMGVGSLLVSVIGQTSPIPIIAATLFVAALFNPVRNRIQLFVDRKFFRERYDYQQGLKEFATKLPSFSDLGTLLKNISTTFAETIHLKSVIPFIFDPDTEEYRVFEPVGLTDDISPEVKFRNENSGLVSLLKKEKKALPIFDLEFDPKLLNLPVKEKEIFKRTETSLSVPMFSKDNLVGILNLGPKLSGKMYNSEDVDFLTTIAGQAAVAVENARLREQELAKKELENELSLARQIQEEFLPSTLPKIRGLDVSAVNIPSKMVSGDYYDLIEIDQNRLGMAMADVSGKGVSASLLMANLQASLRTLAFGDLSLERLVQRINLLIYKNTRADKFITFFYGVLDTIEKKLIYVNAGHNPPFIARNDGTCPMLDCGGLVLGVKKDVLYEEGEVRLSSGESIIMYTDGLVEALNEKEEEFGLKRLRRVVENCLQLKPIEIQENVCKAVKDFTGRSHQEDDLTMVVVKVL